MKRVLVVDDERPVVEGISLILKRDLSAEFEVVGSAASGREAVERCGELAPDIVLMDVRMPGISGLDAVREIRRRGLAPAFVLVTAYERFEIAREAVELGVVEYLLKPVSKDRLASALRAAGAAAERRSSFESREMEHREREQALLGFVEDAFLRGVLLGERFGPGLHRYREVLKLSEPMAAMAAVAFSPPALAPDPEAHARDLHDRVRAALRYKTRAYFGPLVSGCAPALLPAFDEAGAEAAREELSRLFATAFPGELERGELRVGYGGAHALDEASVSWDEALGDLLGRGGELPERRAVSARNAGAGDQGAPFDLDEATLEALKAGDGEFARLRLERMLESLRGIDAVPVPEAYRFIALFGAAYRALARSGALSPEEAMELMDMEDLRKASGGPAFALDVLARSARLSALARRAPRFSPPVARATALVKADYGSPLTLDAVAEVAGVSPGRLSRLLIDETGKGFSEFLIEYRVARAKEMLRVPGASIKEVSITCGYSDPNYFSRLFKKATGQTPTAFAARVQGAIDED